MKLDSLFLIKYGEIALKGKNKAYFIKKLKTNIKKQLKDITHNIIIKWGRFYLQINSDYKEQADIVLSKVCGIVSYSFALCLPKNMEQIEGPVIELAKEQKELKGSNFKIEARRQDKTFRLTSYEIACRLGDVILKAIPELKVNLYHPDWIINIEIREHAYIYSTEKKGPGGLPVGCSGTGVLLLSGGIDSPVAGYLTAKRGLNINSVYFHTHPYTSEKALEKVKTLQEKLALYLPYSTLYIINFTEIQLEIKKQAQANEVTLLSRACMMRIASFIAKTNYSKCLITGESLGQVASQTVESLSFTNTQTEFLVLRPLIGLDKEEIINIARKIETFEISIQPFADCCTIFAPEHPLIRPDLQQITESFNNLELGDMLENAAADAEIIKY